MKKTRPSNHDLVGNSGIKFIYFDVGSVMLNWERGMAKLAERHKRSTEEVMTVFRKYDNDFCRGLYNEKEMWQKYHTELQLTDEKDFAYVEFCVSQFTVIEETHQLACELVNKYKIGLLTNLHPDTFAHILMRKQVPDIEYTAIVQSCEVGHIKPEPEIYHVAQKRAGVAPQEIFFIDDLARNVEAAQKIGWYGHVFDKDNPKQAVKEIKEILAGT